MFPEQRLRNSDIMDFVKFHKTLKKTKLPEKFGLLDKRGF